MNKNQTKEDTDRQFREDAKSFLTKYYDRLFNLVPKTYQIKSFVGVGTAGLFLWKSAWFRKFLVKRQLKKRKYFDYYYQTILPLAQRNDILKDWAKHVGAENLPKPILLVEGYQGTGKSFLSSLFLQAESEQRPTAYLSLRDLNEDNWKQIIAKSINYLPEVTPFARKTIGTSILY